MKPYGDYAIIDAMSAAAINRGRTTDRQTAAGLLAGAAALYLALQLAAPGLSYDGLVYRELAKNIPVTGYTFLGKPFGKFLPLYPGLMAGLDLATGGVLGVERWGLILSLLAGACLPPLLYLFARRAGAEPRWALAAALVQLLAPVGLDQYRDINVMPLFTLELLGAWLLLADRRDLAAGLLLGLAASTRYEVYLLLPAIALSLWREPRRLLWIGAAFAVAAAPWWIRNLILYHQAIHSQYFTEVGYLQFHLHEIALGLVWEAGPLTLLVAVIGFRRLPRPFRVQFAGFALIYIIVHTFWWWYKNRFLLPLLPLTLAPAALGLGQAEGWLAARRGPRTARTLLLLGLALPLLLRLGFFVHETWFTPPDPFRAAGKALANLRHEGTSIGANPFLLYADSGRMAYTWKDLKDNEDPNQLVLKLYLENGARQVVWANEGEIDRKRYRFLADDRPYFVNVQRPDGKWKLSYLPAARFEAPQKVVIIYDLEAERIK